MKKGISWLLLLAILLSLAPVSAFAMEQTIYLPASTETVEEEAFAGNGAIASVFIPENVSRIDKRAFADCTSLSEVIINRTGEIEIAEDAFEGVDLNNVLFIVQPDTPAELVCLSRGFICEQAVPGTQHYDRIQQLVAEHGGTSELQSGSDTKRLIVRRATNRLPDISMYNPVDIVRQNDVFVIQFDDAWNATNCMTKLRRERNASGSPGDYEQYDQIVSAKFYNVQAAGVIDPEDWGTDDPMGFDIYAPFVAENYNGSSKIAVIDSGVLIDGSYENRLDKENARNMTDDGGEWYNDNAAHGSFIAAVINECVGDNDVRILPIRVVNNYTLSVGTTDVDGNVSYALVGDAISYAVEKGADIINLSMCFPSCAHVKYCIEKAREAGAEVVVAAGNEGQTIDSHIFPANLDDVITVAGIDRDYKLVGNYGPSIDYCAPFGWYQTKIGDNLGTSFAAPTIAAALSLLSIDKYHDINSLNSVCYHTNETGTGGNSYGYGMPHLNELAEFEPKALAIDSSLPGQLQIGEELELKWSFTPENTTNQAVTVKSSDETVLSVLDDGKTVKALKKGDATLTITSVRNPGLSVERTFTVVQPVTGITVTGAQEKLILGRSMKLEAIVSPEDANVKEIEWVPTNPALITISPTGLVQVADGVTASQLADEPTVGVTARSTDGYGAQSDTVSFKVVSVPDAERIELAINGKNVTNGEISMIPGEVTSITAKVFPEDAVQNVGFSVFGNYVEVSDAGVVKAVSAGTAHIQVYSVDNRDINATLEVLVRVLPESINLSGNTTINEGQTTTLAARVLPENTTDKSLTWSSSNPSVATVSSTGVVTGVKKGQAIITAKANGDTSVTKSVTVTVRHPYVLSFNTNSPESGLTPSLSATSKSVFSGEALGTLPTASCSYYDFLGWYTAPNGGERKTDSSVIDTTASSVTLYAQWRKHGESGWVLTSAVPSGARITATSYSYRESMESTSSSMAGWVRSGEEWRQTGSGSREYASFPSGEYDTSDRYYTSMAKEPFIGYENETTKRTVENPHTGYIYWHWAINGGYSSTAHRIIAYKKGTYGSDKHWYGYFYSIKTTTKAPQASSDYCTIGQYPSNGRVTYNCRDLINDPNLVPQSDKTTPTSGLKTYRFYELPYYTSTYTDYQKIYKYYRELNYQTVKPNGDNISNLTTYVKYIPR